MLQESTILYDYENLLLGRNTCFNVCFKNGKQEAYREIRVIWRYAICSILGWDAIEAEKNLSLDVIKMLYLDKTYCGLYGEKKASTYIGDYKNILQYVFPNEIKYNEELEAIKIYQKVSKLDEWKYDENNYRFPKKFFRDSDGAKRSEYLLRYAVNRYLGHLSLSEKYRFFSTFNDAKKWINSKNLKLPYDLIYTSPLDYFHTSLAPHKRDHYLFYMFKIKNKCDELINSTEDIEEDNPDETDIEDIETDEE